MQWNSEAPVRTVDIKKDIRKERIKRQTPENL